MTRLRRKSSVRLTSTIAVVVVAFAVLIEWSTWILVDGFHPWPSSAIGWTVALHAIFLLRKYRVGEDHE